MSVLLTVMTTFLCPRCGYETSMIGNLHMHFQRKKPCKPKIKNIPFADLYNVYYSLENQESTEKSDVSIDVSNVSIGVSNVSIDKEIKKNYSCNNCGKSYIHRQSLYTHRKKCNFANGTQNTQTNVVCQPTAQTNVYNCTNNYNQIFILNNFGNETFDYINSDYVKEVLKQPKQGINKLIRQIHFNPGRPENHNVKITNKKMPYASVYKNNSWEFDDKKKIIHQMINKSYGIMDVVYNDQHAELNPSTRRQYEKFQNKFDDNDPQLKRDLEKITELQILNEQKIIG